MLVWLLCSHTTFKEFKATYYGGSFHGNYTYSGEIFDKNRMTCASNHFEMGTILKVTNVENQKSVIVRVNDKGSFTGKKIDLSEKAFSKIAKLEQGIIKIVIKVLKKK